MESTNVIKAMIQQWRASTALQAITIRSTRIPPSPSVVFPYVLVEASVIKHSFHSGLSRVTAYRVTFTVYGGNKKADVDTIGNNINGLFDRNIGLPVVDNCVVIAVQALAEDPGMAPDDYYGADCNTLAQSFKVVCNETISAVRAALAT